MQIDGGLNKLTERSEVNLTNKTVNCCIINHGYLEHMDMNEKF